MPPAFIWRDAPSAKQLSDTLNSSSRLFGVDSPTGTEMLTLFWDGWNYGVPGQPDGGCDMICFQTFPGCDVAVYFNWLGEDSGPNVADAAAVLQLYEQARARFPGAEVVSGGLDVIVEALLQPAARAALPVLTGETAACLQQVWTETGVLVASFMQEGLVRPPRGSSVHETQVLSCLLMGVELGVEVRYEVCGWMAMSN